MRSRFLRSLVFAGLLFALAHPLFARAQNSGFELAFTPFLPVRTLMQNYQPMRAYLELRLGEPVTLVTAPDYKTYNERMRQHEYPFLIAVANSAYLAHAEYGYVPMLRPTINTRPALIVAKSSALTSIKELRGATLTMSDPLALVSMQGMQMLRDAGLDPAHDVTIKHLSNHAAAVNYVLSGEAAAAIVSDRALQQMPEATRNAVRVVQTWERGAAPGVVYLASPLVPQARVERLKQTILEFTRDTAEGRELIKNLGYGSLAPATPEDLKPLAPHGALLKEALSAAP